MIFDNFECLAIICQLTQIKQEILMKAELYVKRNRTISLCFFSVIGHYGCYSLHAQTPYICQFFITSFGQKRKVPETI